jgi:alpha-tubulin suppressor-like RCC1 family protein
MCGLLTDGTIACWGDNSFGGATPPKGTFAQVSVGNTFSCALDQAGREWCWGSIARQPL